MSDRERLGYSSYSPNIIFIGEIPPTHKHTHHHTHTHIRGELRTKKIKGKGEG
jgi:hypothetical protein